MAFTQRKKDDPLVDDWAKLQVSNIRWWQGW